MKTDSVNMKPGLMVIALLVCVGSGVLNAQAPDAERQGNKPPQPPILAALDSDQDNVISAAEIGNAEAALKSLDKNQDGQLSADEYRPARPSGNGGMGGSEGSAGNMGNPPPGGGAGPGMSGGQPPKMPVDSALDADGDGVIAADEIANAAGALRQLDKNGDGRLAMDECLPARPGSGK